MSTNAHNIVTNTPPRDRHQFNSSSNATASPATALRSNALASSSGSSAVPAAASLSVEGILSAHANTPNAAMAALEQALSERNTLSGQNAQLWKLIEKQRTAYSQIVKELERLRGERDNYKSRLHSLVNGGEPPPATRRNKEKENGIRAVPQGHGSPASESTHDVGASSSGQSAVVVERRDSEDIATPRNTSHALLSPRLHEQISSPAHGHASPHHHSRHTPAHRSDSSHPPHAELPPSLPSGHSESPQGRPLHVVQKKAASLPNPGLDREPAPHPTARPAASIPSASPVEGRHIESSVRSGTSVQHVPASTPPTSPPLGGPETPGSVQPPSVVSSSPSAYSSSSQDSSATSPQLLTPTPASVGLTVQTGHLRESRIDLPDEARQYIVNMVDSPLLSPRHGETQAVSSFRTGSAVAINGTPGNAHGSPEEHPQQQQQQPLSRVEFPSRSDEFLEMIDEEVTSKSVGDEDIGIVKQKQRKLRAAVEDFPMPPTHGPVSPPAVRVPSDPEAPTQTHVNADSRGGLPVPLPTADSLLDVSPSGYSDTLVDTEVTLGPNIRRASSLPFPMESTSTLASTVSTFRALPLLAADLPRTRITVSHSSVRANERGKEVLSFIVYVEPGHDKPGWRIEKLYSDVLSLDARIRASVGKGVGKKIASLPEGKLWRDHAPAKVDQRKIALENYLQTLINLPVKNKDEVIAFFTSDIVREAKQPVSQAGYKEGYLTKRGKNFGGWKTRYFVLQGPVLEYYESRGGAHLGSISITGAQIGRQQRNGDRRETDEEKEYRHAFLIIEARKSQNGNNPRHVLCADSDADRDSWVDVLVRYVSGSYSEDPVPPFGPSPIYANAAAAGGSAPRSSTSSTTPSESAASVRQKQPVRMSSDLMIAKGPAVPISQLQPDAANAKFFHRPSAEEMRAPSPVKSLEPSPVERHSTSTSSGVSDAYNARRRLEKGHAASVIDVPLSSSLPTSSVLDGAGNGGLHPFPGQRANSELGHYTDMHSTPTRPRQHSPEHQRSRERNKAPSSLSVVEATPAQDRPATPEGHNWSDGKVKISGPLNGAPIPAGYKFGGKDSPAEGSASSDRREKAKSRSFWGFGRPNDKHVVAQPASRAVFGVTLEESLEVAQIANLPAIVFRCIQYLEAKKTDQEEGIYRLSGSSNVIKSLKDRFNAEGDVDLLASDDFWDPHAIAGLLKSFLRELPASILTRDLHLNFLAVIDFVDAQERIHELSHLISLLPLANYTLLRALTAHLILIVQNAHVNKMTMRNVGIVFSPTLGIPAGVFSLMLAEFNRVFNVDGEGDEEGEAEDGKEEGAVAKRRDVDGGQVEANLSRRNSRQYSDAAADQLLGLSGRTLSTPAEEAEGPSDEGDDFSMDGSTEATTENDATESSNRSSPALASAVLPHPSHSPHPSQTLQVLQQQQLLSPQSAGGSGRAANVAASRGLTLAVGKNANRHSRMIGLPVSPRPAMSSPRLAETREVRPSPATPEFVAHHGTPK